MPVRNTTRHASAVHPFRLEQIWEGSSRLTLLDIRARRCAEHYEGDQAQVEIAIRKRKHGGQRDSYAGASLILTPAEARELALAICPELAP